MEVRIADVYRLGTDFSLNMSTTYAQLVLVPKASGALYTSNIAEPLRMEIFRSDTAGSAVVSTTSNLLVDALFIHEIPILASEPQSLRHPVDDPSLIERGRS